MLMKFAGGKVAVLLLCVLLVTTLSTGCVKTGGVTTPTSTTTAATTATGTTTPTSTPATKTSTPASQPAGGQGILNLADTGPITLDPATAAEASSAQYIVQIFSGLVRLDKNMDVVPDIAQSWDKSTDGKTYTFHLRQDVKFQNGKQVTAADFKYSWERALNPATQSLTAGTYLNDIVGAADILNGKTTQLSGVKVVDNYTLEVTIDAPKAYFLDKMAYPTAFVVDRENVASGSEWWRKPNGTGPFRLKEWQVDQLVVLERNPLYYGDKALLSEVDYQLFSGNPIELYQEGNIDVSFVGAAYMGLVSDPTNPISKELQTYPELSLYYIGFNCTVPPFDDAKVRQAFSYAVDKERLATLTSKTHWLRRTESCRPGCPGTMPIFRDCSLTRTRQSSLSPNRNTVMSPNCRR